MEAFEIRHSAVMAFSMNAFLREISLRGYMDSMDLACTPNQAQKYSLLDDTAHHETSLTKFSYELCYSSSWHTTTERNNRLENKIDRRSS